VASSCEHGNELMGSIKGRIFLDQLNEVKFSLWLTKYHAMKLYLVN